jgi:hypothetical protein
MIGCDRPKNLCDFLFFYEYGHFLINDLLSIDILDNDYLTLILFDDDLG